MIGGIVSGGRGTYGGYQKPTFGGGGGGGPSGGPAVDPKKLLGDIFGTGGGSMGNTQPIKPQNLTPMNINVQQNPAMEGILGEMKQQQAGLAAGNDIDATNALMRQRDMASGMMKEYGAMAGRRGFGPSSGMADIGRSRLMGQFSRNATGMNAGLASDARRQQREMLGQRAGTTAQQAAITQGQQNFALNQWQAQNGMALQAQQAADQQQQNNFNNQMQLFNTLSNFYSG